MDLGCTAIPVGRRVRVPTTIHGQ